MPRPKRRQGINLLSGAEAQQDALAAKTAADPAEPAEIISLFVPNVTLAMVDDFTAYPSNSIPQHVRAVLRINLV